MKIDGSNPFPFKPVSPVNDTGPSSKPEPGAVAPKTETEETDFSTVTNTSALLSQLKQMPEIRQQRVEALREAIQSGRYRVSDRQIANALFAKLLAPRSVQ